MAKNKKINITALEPIYFEDRRYETGEIAKIEEEIAEKLKERKIVAFEVENSVVEEVDL